MFDTKPYENKMRQALMHFEDELKKARTGRAHASMLSDVSVDAYGTKLPLNQVANVTAPEAQMLLVTPFDPGMIRNIVASIRDDQSLGFNPSDDGRVVRVPVPPLTEERRRQIVKQTSEKVEDAKIALRNIRQDAIKDAKRKKDTKELGEDDIRAVEKEIDKLTRDFQDKAEAEFKKKEQEILSI